MNQTQSMNGKYYRTCMNDIKASEGWFGKICLLGLISFIPIFGQMTVYGYAYEWAHKAAWGVSDPMPKKIYSRPGSKMLRWGWFALAIIVIFAIVPSIISMIGSALNTAGTPHSVYSYSGHRTVGSGSPALLAAGGLLSFIGWILAIFVYMFAWVANIRMTIYDRFGAGMQLGKVWKMATHDFGGLMRILGMSLIWGIGFAFIGGILMMIVLGIAIGPAIASGMFSASSNAIAGVLITSLAVALPFLLVLIYFMYVAQAFLNILVARAVGYWARQFDVPAWGTKDDPMPFEVQAAQQAQQYQAPQQQPMAQQPMSQPVAQPVQSTVQEPIAQAAQEPAVQSGTPSTQPSQGQAAQPESAADSQPGA